MSRSAQPPSAPLQLLHLEDDAADAELTLETLREAGLWCEETRVDTRSAFEQALLRGRPSPDRPPFELVLADYVVPGFGGSEALAVARRLRPDLPFIVISGKMGEEVAIETLRAGATDYVLKQRLGRLGFAVKRALHERGLERERELALEQLAELGSRLQARTILEQVLEQMPAGVMVARAPDGRVLALNDYARSLLALEGPVETIADVARAHVYLPDGRRADPEELPSRRALASGELVRDLVLEFRPPGAPAVFSQTSATPLRDPAGAVVGVVATYTDVTASKQYEEMLRQQVEFREHLVAIVSHDLRQPLSAIRNSTYLLSHQGLAAAGASRALAAIEKSVARMSALIRDLLDFAQTRLGAGLPMSRRATDLGALATEVIDEVRATHPGRVFELSAEGAVLAEVDPDRMHQVLVNLIENAVAHGARGTPIRVAVWHASDGPALEVRNEGGPIPPDLLPTLFEPFRRGRSAGERNVGLGLYIVDQIVRAHGGSVRVRSSADEGTCFTVRLLAHERRARGVPVH